MPRFAANLTMMFNERPLRDRFAAAADAGFDAVEILFPYEMEPGEVAELLVRNGLTLALFNCPPGDWENGERGFASRPERFDEFKASIGTALRYAAATGVGRLHLMAGKTDRADPAHRDAFRRAVAWAAEEVGRAGLDLVLEPINGRDMPGYFLNDFAYADSLIRELAIPNLKLQFDLYHRQILHGDVAMALRAAMPIVGHIQIASVPSRNEPDGEELSYPFLFAELDRLGYGGFIGCEYRPRGRTEDGLGWFEPYRRRERGGPT